MKKPNSESQPFVQLRMRLMEAVRENAAFDGWSGAAITAAARQIGLSEGEVLLAAPNGAVDLIDAWARQADAHMVERLARVDLSALKVRQRVTLAVRTRIEAYDPWKQAARRASGAILLPPHAPRAAGHAWRTADCIWRTLGDRSTDGNWYSKRLILSGVYASTLAVWISADEDADVWAFLDRRIDNVMAFEKIKAQAGKVTSNLPNPVGLLARLSDRLSR
jgi:ubiquinone biosynthesis protein COQ9